MYKNAKILQKEKENLSLLSLESNKIKGMNSSSTQNREKDNPDFSPIATSWTGSPFGEKGLTMQDTKEPDSRLI